MTESNVLDFKEPSPSEKETVRKVVDAAICFTNSEGGEVVLGVADDGAGPAALVGTEVDAAYLKRRIYDLTVPPLVVDVHEELVDGSRLLVIRVPQSPEIHADTQGRATRRVGTDCLPLSPQDQTRMREERLGIDWSAARSKETTSDDVRAEALTVARRRLARFDDSRRQLSRASDVELLQGLRVADAEGRLLNAGVVLLCSPPEAFGDHWISYLYRPTPGSELTAREAPGGSMLEAFERVEELVRARRRTTPVLVPGGQQIEVEDFPISAVREALSNAVLHRDYHLRGPVVVDHSPQVFAAISPGPLVHGVSPHNILRHPSSPRNPRLAHAARVLGLAEEVGAGVDRMYRAMLSTGKELPTIVSEPDHVRVSLVGGAPDTQVARFVAQLPDEERNDVDTMIALFHLRAHRHLQAGVFADLVQKPEDEAEAVLRRLASEQVRLIEPTRDTARLRQPRYRLRAESVQALGTAVSYHRRTTDDVDRRIIEMVRNYGHINNGAVQTLFDVDVYQASGVLKELVERDILVRTSKATRGPSVQYGPGTAFPKPSNRRRRRV